MFIFLAKVFQCDMSTFIFQSIVKPHTRKKERHLCVITHDTTEEKETKTNYVKKKKTKEKKITTLNPKNI